MFENNQQNVSVKWSHGARFDCVVYHIYTVENLLQTFIKLVVILNKFYMCMQRITLLFHVCNFEVIYQCMPENSIAEE